MTYHTPPSFANGEYLSAYKLRILAANDDHFNGVADAMQMAPTTMGRSFIGSETEIPVFDGFIFLTQNTIKYAMYLSDDADNEHIHLYLDYEGDDETLVATHSAVGEQALQTYDATAWEKNRLWRVTALLHRDTNGSALGELRKFYETYSGALSFTAPNAFTDGNASAVAHLQALADNDAYFRAIESENHPSVGIAHAYLASESSRVIWRGWVKHLNNKVFWRWAISSVAGGNTLKLYYDYGGGGQELVATLSAAETEESSATLAGAFTPGTWYQVAVLLSRTDTGEDASGTIHYVETGAAAMSAGFTPLGEFMPGQFGWGTTANQRTRLDLLGANDTDLTARLELRNNAIKKALYTELGGDIGGSYALRRRKNVLYYRGKNLTMTWGTDNSMGLNDYDASHAHWTLDLGAVSNLIAGQVYTITSTSNEAEFAQERES